MLDTNTWKKGESEKLLKILEDLVDYLINTFQPKLEEHLINLSLSLLHGIHTVYPPPSVTKYGIPDPISESKLEKGQGLRETGNEVLGFIFDKA